MIVYLFAALVLAVLILWMLYRASSGALKAERDETDRLITELAHRDNIIIKLQEAQRVQTVRTEKISTGSIPDRVAGSLDVLQDIARVGAARAGKN